MFQPEVVAQLGIGSIIVLFTVRFAKVTPKVHLAQVSVESIVVKKTTVTKLAERVSLVTLIIRIAFPAMSSQLLSSVRTELVGKKFQIIAANIAVQEAVCFTGVISEEMEGGKDGLLSTLETAIQ